MKNPLTVFTVRAWINAMQRPIRNGVSVTLLAGLIVGCATGSKDSILPSNLPTMEQIYEAHTQHKPIPKSVPVDPVKQEQGSNSMERAGGVVYTANAARNAAALVRQEAKLTPPVKPVLLNAATDDSAEPHVASPNAGRLIRTVQTGTADLVGYTREASNELDNTFSVLPNPVLVMYVYPHLSGVEGTPVPGYTTKFSMYEKPEFALPGEVASQP